MPVKPRQFAKALKKLGFEEVRQKGSHCIFAHNDGRYVIVPMHATDLKTGLYHGLLKQAGITDAELRKLI
ncbi:MAG: type II toxin-antitoxin system HicA family toxin [Candidatus Melainabacteria bacterium]